MPFRWLVPQCARFDEDDIKKIIGAGERIVRTVSWTIDGTDEFMSLLKNFGCEIRGKKVKFTDKVVDITLERIKEEKKKNQPNIEEKEFIEASRKISYSTSGQGIWCADPETGKIRAATKKDQADFSRVVNSFDGLGRTHPTFIPQDAPPRTRELHAYITIMLNSDKPYRVSAYSPEVLDYFVEANTIYYGSKEKGIQNLLLPAKVWVNTPFMISRESIEASMKLRALTGRPLTYNAMPNCGIATPVTPDGALALITAEVIGINAISLAIDNILAGWATGPLSFDMKEGIDTEWGPETITIATAGQQVAAYLFGHRAPGLFVNTGPEAPIPGIQSMMERAFGLGMAFVAGIRNFGGLARLAGANVGSTVQLMLDMELISCLKKLVRGFEVSEETLAEELIKEVAPQGAHFLEQEHTARYFRKYQWFPEFMNRRNSIFSGKKPKTMLEEAKKKALYLIKTAPNKCPLKEYQKKELLKLLDVADRELG